MIFCITYSFLIFWILDIISFVILNLKLLIIFCYLAFPCFSFLEFWILQKNIMILLFGLFLINFEDFRCFATMFYSLLQFSFANCSLVSFTFVHLFVFTKLNIGYFVKEGNKMNRILQIQKDSLKKRNKLKRVRKKSIEKN